MAIDANFLISLAQNFWYLGVFAIGFFSSFLLFLPTPSFAVIFLLASPQFGFNTFLLGLVGGLGAAVGELIGYLIGYGSKQVLLKKHEKDLLNIKRKFKKYGDWMVIFVFSFLPLPFDIVGIFCGVINYPPKKFFIPLLVGKVLKYLLIAYAGYLGIGWISQYFVVE
jgi:membrane protein YqaA with SNARE-associated domain